MLLKNGKTLTIRKARKEDAQECIDYLKKVGSETDNLTIGAEGVSLTVEQEENFLENTGKSLSSAILVGVIDYRIICIGSIMSRSGERLAHQATLGITVLKEFWGLGVGTHMMNALIEFAKNSGTIEIIGLGVKSDNTNAIALYKKFGFREIGRYPKFFKINGVYYDEILMNLYL